MATRWNELISISVCLRAGVKAPRTEREACWLSRVATSTLVAWYWTLVTCGFDSHARRPPTPPSTFQSAVSQSAADFHANLLGWAASVLSFGIKQFWSTDGCMNDTRSSTDLRPRPTQPDWPMHPGQSRSLLITVFKKSFCVFLVDVFAFLCVHWTVLLPWRNKT